MVAGLLVVLVFVNAFMTGWLLRNEREVSRKYDSLRSRVDSFADELYLREHDAR